MSGAKSKVRKQAQALLEWFARQARDLPWRRTQDPYAIWVSEIMLQQTQVKTVIPYWERWMKALPNLPALARENPDRLHKLWEGLGYYSRVRNLQKAARRIMEKHHGVFPEVFEQVLDLPGIGRYTAGAICSIAFNQPRPVLDGNVIRVLTRVHGLDGDPKEKTLNHQLWRLAGEWVLSAVGRHGKLNEALMELGALVCLPRGPLCDACPLSKWCVARHEKRVAVLPGIPRRPASTPRCFVAFVVQRKGRFLVVQRPPDVVNGNLWEFPNRELKPGNLNLLTSAASGPVPTPVPGLHTAAKSLGIRLKALTPLCTIKHSITRYRITLHAFETHAASIDGDLATRGKWFTLSGMQKLPFASAHRKIHSAVLKMVPEEGIEPPTKGL